MRLHWFAAPLAATVLSAHVAHAQGSNRYRFTDTWLLRNGKWQAIAAQDYLIPR